VIPLAATGATRLSLHVELEGGARLEDGAVIEDLILDLECGTVRLGRCRFDATGGTARESHGDLVFLDDVYDCRALLVEGTFVAERAAFHNLPVVLALRERIRPEFREYCANLAYDLSVYRRFFDDLDRSFAGEPERVVEAARAVVRAREGREFAGFMDGRVAELEHVVHGYTSDEHERHGFYLRRHLWPYIAASECLTRTNLKPAGYSGDAEVMVMLYENAFRGASTFEQLMHKYPVETRAAEAVRSRRRVIPRLLRAFEARARRPGKALRVLSLACGPACELDEVYAPPADLDAIEYTLLDQDPHALELARAVVRRIEAQRGHHLKARYVDESVRTMLRTRELRHRLGTFDYVYSMGLFDYLTTPVARAVLARTFDLLGPGGEIVIGNFHANSPTRVYMDYFADWPLTYRTEESFLAVAEGLEVAEREILYDETRCQMFLRLVRPA
jgi:extracellular factor (EF) 3-hydroxypalmitic acid methyl ester biosynthesis protein